MKTLWTVVYFLCLVTSTQALDDFKELLEDGSNIFNTNAKGFMTLDKSKQFFWLDEKRMDARYSDERAMKKLTFFGMKVWEVVLSFTPNGTKDIAVSLFNRGDAGELKKSAFDALLLQLDDKLTGWAGAEGEDRKRVRLAKGKGYIRSRVWIKLPYHVIAEWVAGEQRFAKWDAEQGRFIENPRDLYRADYLRLKITQNTGTNISRSRPSKGGLTTRATSSRAKLKENVVQADNGDVYVDNIPMVDQGQKGYCAVCVSSRMLKYYGSDIGQDIIAQLADASSVVGTSNEKMMEMIGKADVKLGIKVKNYKIWDWGDFRKKVKDYNRLAKRAGKRELAVHTDLMLEFWNLVDPEILRETCCEKQKNNYRKFLGDIEKNIAKGVPVIWGAMLGLYEEGGRMRPKRGPHLRLIIGYNKREEQILFSDTWGSGHEKKYIGMKEAWAMTNTYSTFTPRNR